MVFRLGDPLATLVATHVAGHFAALMDHPDLAGVGTHQDGLAGRLRRDRIPVAVELELGQRADDGRDDFVRIERLRRQGTQQRAFFLKPIHGTLARACRGDARWPPGRASTRPAGRNSPSG